MKIKWPWNRWPDELQAQLDHLADEIHEIRDLMEEAGIDLTWDTLASLKRYFKSPALKDNALGKKVRSLFGNDMDEDAIIQAIQIHAVRAGRAFK